MTTEAEIAPDPYPEHAKLRAVVGKSQACGEFLEWLAVEKGLVLAQRHEHEAACYPQDGRGACCGMSDDAYHPGMARREALLAEFFEIDEAKLDTEKRAMLDELRRSA